MADEQMRDLHQVGRDLVDAIGRAAAEDSVPADRKAAAGEASAIGTALIDHAHQLRTAADTYTQMIAYGSHPDRATDESLYREFITIHPVESVRDGWHEAGCSLCDWSTTGEESPLEDEASEHIGEHVRQLRRAGWMPIAESTQPGAAGRPAAVEPLDPSSQARAKTNYIGSPACLLLDQALMPVHAAFPDALGIYQVGSSVTRPDWRDIDVRMILTDEDFERLFGDHHLGGSLNAMWSLLCASVSRHLSAVTGLPVDFQVQGMTRANILHKGARVPVGIFVASQPRPLADAVDGGATP